MKEEKTNRTQGLTRNSKSPYLDSGMAHYYAEASARHQFDRPARDLVTWLKIAKGEKILDIGSGSGMVASAAFQAVGSSGWVVALDSSIEMLKRQQAKGLIGMVLARAPDFPFVDQVFDCAVAGFVLSHFPDYSVALREITRVLRPTGVLGATAWESGTTRISEVWKSLMEHFVDSKAVQEEFRRIIPWDEFFSDSTNLLGAFHNAGLVDVKTHTKDYVISLDSRQYIATKMGSVEGTIVRNLLQEEDWKTFLQQLATNLQNEFPNGIEYTRNVHFIFGRKPLHSTVDYFE